MTMYGGGVPCIASRRQRGERQGHHEGSRAAARETAGEVQGNAGGILIDYMLRKKIKK